MGKTRTLKNIQLVLHMSSDWVKKFAKELERNYRLLPHEERHWRHVSASTDAQLLVFGRKGLKRVSASALVFSMAEQGFRYQSCVIGFKRPPHGRGAWQYALEITFEHDPKREREPEIGILDVLIAVHEWKRGRVHWLLTTDERDAAIVELIRPRMIRSGRVTELDFEPPGTFVQRPSQTP